MEPVTLILAALAAGGSAGALDALGAGKYTVTIRDSVGFQVGNGNVQVNRLPDS